MSELPYEPVIGLEVHAELETRSKMFCACARLDSTSAAPNQAVCPVCAGMPGVLPVVNRRAVEFALRVALALECTVEPVSTFARKNYFYPDLPKGYQISMYEQPLARHGRLRITTSQGEREIRIRRVHLEEDTAKLTHVVAETGSYSLVDLNRAGVPLLEIVTEPDLHTPEEVRQFAIALRSLLRYLRVNSGDLEKGVIRLEPNISLRPRGSDILGTRVEIKNLNSLRALERSLAYEIQRQAESLRRGERVYQETRGWDERLGETVLQRRKEGEDDYRYFPEPDLPPLVVGQAWLEEIRHSLPELPQAREQRFQAQYGLTIYDAALLTAERATADYYEAVLEAGAPPKSAANWISGELFGLLNQSGQTLEEAAFPPAELAALIELVAGGRLNQAGARQVLAEAFASGEAVLKIVARRGLQQVSDAEMIAGWVRQVLQENPEQVRLYQAGKETLSRWFFGQVMRRAGGQANPQAVQAELERQLRQLAA